MASEQENTSAEESFKEKELLAAEPLSLEQSTEALARYGGFDLLETTIDGISNLNPARQARRDIFLAEPSRKNERKQLKKRLLLWKEILENNATIAEMATMAQSKADADEALLKKNLAIAVKACRTLETSYRSAQLFYKNTEADKVKNVSILNADMEDLKDTDLDRAFQSVNRELSEQYDRLDLRDNYSLLVMPGYLGTNSVISKWGKMAYKNKVMLVTDFADMDTPEDVMEMFGSAKHTGGDEHLANVIMTSNWLVGRSRYEELGKDDQDLFVPPAGALAGRIYSTLASQVTAGKKHGTLNDVDGVKFKLKKSEISDMEKLGLVPMVGEYGRVMAFSAKTLFNGDNIGLQTYSVVRVFDWVTKVLIDFLNRRAFENYNHNMKQELQSQIIRFLDNITGPGKLIEKFTFQRLEQDKASKQVFLDIHMTPYFPAKSFVISLDGTKGDDADDAKWNSSYKQQ